MPIAKPWPFPFSACSGRHSKVSSRVLIREAVVIVVGQIQIEQRILVKAPELIDVGDRQLVLKLKRPHAVLGPEMERHAVAAELDFLGKLLPDVAQQHVDRRIGGLGSQGTEPAVRRLARGRLCLATPSTRK